MLWVPAIDYGCRFGHHFWRRASGERRAESDSSKTVQPLRMAAHVSEAGNPLNPHRRGGKRLTVVVMFVVFFCVGRRPQYCTIPTVQNLQSLMFFVPPARILISAKLLILNPAKAPSLVPFRRGSLHWIGKIYRSVAVGRANGSPLWWCLLVSWVIVIPTTIGNLQGEGFLFCSPHSGKAVNYRRTRGKSPLNLNQQQKERKYCNNWALVIFLCDFFLSTIQPTTNKT